MDVLVGVDVGECKAAALQQIDLRRSLRLKFSGIHAPGNEPPQKRPQRGLETPGSLPCFLPRFQIEERRNLLRLEHRRTVYQNHVAAHPQRRRGQGNLDCLFGRLCPSHQRSAGQHCRPMQLRDRLVDPCGQPKIIGIENKAPHGVSLSIQPALLVWSTGAMG